MLANFLSGGKLNTWVNGGAISYLDKYKDEYNSLFNLLNDPASNNKSVSELATGFTNIPQADIDSITRYSNEHKNGEKNIKKWTKSVEESGGTISQTTNDINAGSKILRTVGATVLNTAATALAFLAVETGMKAAATAWDNYSKKQEKAIEKGNETLNKHKENIQKYADSTKVIDSVGERFEELRKGVSSSGKNIGLTTDEFKEYQDIVSQLSTSMPSLIDGYDSLGNPIISATTNVRQLTEALREQQQTISNENISKAQDYADAFNATITQTPTDFTQESGLLQQRKMLDAMIADINSGQNIAKKYFDTGEIGTFAAGLLNPLDTMLFKTGDIASGFISGLFEHLPLVNGSGFELPDGIKSVISYISGSQPGTRQLGTISKLASAGSEFVSSLKEGEGFAKSIGDSFKSYLDPASIVSDNVDKTISDILTAQDIAEKAGVNESVLKDIRGNKSLDSETEQYVRDKVTAYQKQVTAEMNSQFDNTKPFIESVLTGGDNNSYYNALKDETKSVISQVIDSMEFSDGQALGFIGEDGTLNTDAIKNWGTDLTRSINKSGVEDSISELFSLKDKSGEMGFKEYANEFNSLADGISQKVPQITKKMLASATGLGDNLDDLKQKRVDLMNDGFGEGLLNDLSNEDLEILWDLNVDGVVEGAANAKKAIEDAKKAIEDSDPDKYFNAWQEATQTANQGSKYDTMRSGFESAYDSYKKGLVGTDDFTSFAAMISPTGSDDARNFAENYPKFQRYFTEGKEGIDNFLADISSVVDGSGQAFAQLDQNTGKWKFNVTDAQDLATRLGVGVEMVGAMFGKMQEYGIDNNVVTSVEQGAQRTGDLISSLSKENKELGRLTSKSDDDKYGYNTDAGEHTVGDQTAIDESRRKIQDYNASIQETAQNTRALIKAQNESSESQQKAAISAVKSLNEQKKAAEEAGLQDTADMIQAEMDKYGEEYKFDVTAEVNFDVSEATDSVESLLNSAWRKEDAGGDVSGNLDTISQKIQEIGSHDGDISALVSQFNDLAEVSGSVYRMDSEGEVFTFGSKIGEIREIANEVQSLADKGVDASEKMGQMAVGIQSLASAGGDISGLVDQYNQLAESTGSEYRMEVTGEVVSVEDYSGETPEVEMNAKVNVDTSGLASDALSALSKWGDDTISVPVEIAMQDSGFSDVVNRIHDLTNGNHEIALRFGLEGGETPEQIAQGLLNGSVTVPASFEVTNKDELTNAEPVNVPATYAIANKDELTGESNQPIEVPASLKLQGDLLGGSDPLGLLGGNNEIPVKGRIDSVDESGVGDINVDVRGTLMGVDTVGVNSVSVPIKGQLMGVDTTGVNSVSIPTKGKLTSVDGSGVGDTNVDVRGILMGVDTVGVNSVSVPVNGQLMGVDTTGVGSVTVNVRGIMTGVDGNVGDKSANATVKFDKDSSAVDSYQPPNKTATATYILNAPAPPNYPNMSRTVTYTIQTIGKPPAYRGTANPSGSAFAQGSTRTANRVGGLYPIPHLSARALAMGTLQDETWLNPNWRTKKSEVALTGEVGQELVVKGNRWWTVGDNGAEFSAIPQGSIVFNARQTRELLKNGKINSRGKVRGNIGDAKATGTATSRPALAGGTAETWIDKLSGFIDWVEVKLKRMQRYTENAFKNMERITHLNDKQSKMHEVLSLNRNEIDNNRASYDKYMARAEEIWSQGNLNPLIKWQIHNGSLDISDYDDDTKKIISAYQDYYEKALDCADAVDDLIAKQAEYAQQALDNIDDYYSMMNDVDSAAEDMLKSKNDVIDAIGESAVSDSVRGNLVDARNQEEKQYERLQQKLKDYEAEIDKLVSSGYMEKYSAEWFEANKHLHEITVEMNESRIALEEYTDSIRNLTYTKIQNAIDNIGNTISTISNKISLKLKRGETVTEGEYKGQINQNLSAVDERMRLRNEKLKEMSVYDSNSAKYRELADDIAKLDDEIYGLLEDNEDLKDSIRELRWDSFNKGIDKINNISEEYKDLMGFLDKDAFFDSNGGLTADGAANIALIGQAITQQKKLISEYTTALSKLDQELKNGVITQSEYTEQQDGFLDNIRDAAGVIDDYKNSLIDMYKEQLKAENDAVQESIDKHRELLDAKRENEEYNRKLRNQNKEANVLRAQIAALSGVTSEQGKAQLKLLQQQLAETEDELAQTRSDREYDVRKKGYEGLSTDINDALDDTLEEITLNANKQEEVVANMLNSMIGMYSEAYGKINQIISSTGIKTSGDVASGIGQIGTSSGANSIKNNVTSDQSSVKPSYAGNTATGSINTGSSSTESIIGKPISTTNRKVAELTIDKTSLSLMEGSSGKIVASVRPTDAANKNLVWESKNNSVASVSSSGSVTAKRPGTTIITVKTSDGGGLYKTCNVTVTAKPVPPPPPEPEPTPQPEQNTDPYNGIPFSPKKSYYPKDKLNIDTSIVDRLAYFDFANDFEACKKLYDYFHWNDGVTYVGSAYQNMQMLEDMKIRGYKNGSKRIGSSQLAVTQEDGRELIISPSRNEVLTQLNSGDSVVPNNLTENLFKWGKYAPQEFVSNLKTPITLPNIDGGTTTIENHYDALLKIDGSTITKDSIPEIENLLKQSYEYTKKQMAKDVRFYSGKNRRI